MCLRVFSIVRPHFTKMMLVASLVCAVAIPAIASASDGVGNSGNVGNVSNASNVGNASTPFVDEETAELMFRVGGVASSLGQSGVNASVASGVPPYSRILRNALMAGEGVLGDDDYDYDADYDYCWQCVEGVYISALERLPISLRTLLQPPAPSAVNYSYAHLLRTPYASGIDEALLSRVVSRLNVATLRASHYPYAATLVSTSIPLATTLEGLRLDTGVRLQQFKVLCFDGSGNGYSTSMASSTSASTSMASSTSTSTSASTSMVTPYSYCDYAQWVQLRYVMESVPNLLTTHPATDIAMFVADFAETLQTATPSTIPAGVMAELPLSRRAVQGGQVLKESLYGDMLKDYTANRGQEAYLNAITLQRVDALYGEYLKGEQTKSQYWQRTAREYAKESYAIMSIGEASVISVAGGCWGAMGSASTNTSTSININATATLGDALRIGVVPPSVGRVGSGDAGYDAGYDADIVCFGGVQGSQDSVVAVVNTNRPYQYTCKADDPQLKTCLADNLNRAVADEVASLLREAAPDLFNHYQYYPIWATIPANDGSAATNITPPLHISLEDIFKMNKQALLFYIAYQYLTTESYTG